SSCLGRDHRHTAGHRLKDHKSKRFLPGRNKQDIDSSEELRTIHETEELQRESTAPLLQRVDVRLFAFSTNQQTIAVSQDPQRFKCIIMALVRSNLSQHS